MATALIVDDSAESRQGLEQWLAKRGFGEVHGAATIEQARAALAGGAAPDLVLLDLSLPDGDGLQLLPDLEGQPEAEIVIVTGHGSVESAVEALRGGVVDYLTKPLDLRRLDEIVRKLHRSLALRVEVETLRGELRRLGRFGSLIGASPAMQKVYDLVARVAPSSGTVLITGETGTGKELAAQTVHQLSRRASAAFLPVNCAAVAPNLIESELFGHERGSFTGAERQHKGIFERAHGGTLLLDEITEMPLELQSKLLRVLETGSFTRIGGDRPLETDVRVIAATNRPLEKAVEDGKLREDLLYRLNVLPVGMPPLRERDGDVELLASHFLERLNREAGTTKRFADGVLRRMRDCAWPGNVRQLKNVVERAFVLADDEIGPECIPAELAPAAPADGSAVTIGLGSSVAEAERKLILATLAHLDGNKKKAADVLGISLKTLYNRLAAYEART